MSIQQDNIKKLVERRAAAAMGGGQKRIDAQFRKKDTVYEIRYSVKSVRSLNNAKDDQSLS